MTEFSAASRVGLGGRFDSGLGGDDRCGSASGWTPVAFDLKVQGLQKDETFALDSLYVDPWASQN